MNTSQARDVDLGRLFVRLADSLVKDFDVVELLQELATNCVTLLEAGAAGIMLADPQGTLQVIATSSEEAELLELFELQNQQGPGLDCYRTGSPTAAITAAEQSSRWPIFAGQLRDRGFGPVYALPLRLREQTIGALNIFQLPDQPLPEADRHVGQALADVATIAVLEHRTHEASARLAVQLQTALNSRIAVEQAKGVIAEHAGVSIDRAFELLRSYARSSRRRLTLVATGIAAGEIPASVVLDTGRPHRSR